MCPVTRDPTHACVIMKHLWDLLCKDAKATNAKLTEKVRAAEAMCRKLTADAASKEPRYLCFACETLLAYSAQDVDKKTVHVTGM
jgi:Zn finger protein HypA/HybF involved in hydrogenase expression